MTVYKIYIFFAIINLLIALSMSIFVSPLSCIPNPLVFFVYLIFIIQEYKQHES